MLMLIMMMVIDDDKNNNNNNNLTFLFLMQQLFLINRAVAVIPSDDAFCSTNKLDRNPLNKQFDDQHEHSLDNENFYDLNPMNYTASHQILLL